VVQVAEESFHLDAIHVGCKCIRVLGTPRFAAVNLEGAVEVARFDRRAVPRGEEGIGVAPLRFGCLAFVS
jgi:hypothetical protein